MATENVVIQPFMLFQAPSKFFVKPKAKIENVFRARREKGKWNTNEELENRRKQKRSSKGGKEKELRI